MMMMMMMMKLIICITLPDKPGEGLACVIGFKIWL
jgi:hypothetical protein